LQQGKVDGVVLSELTLVKWKHDAESSPVPIDVLQPPLFVEPWGIGMRKEETALIKQVNDVLTGMEKSGEATKIFDKWLGTSTQYNLHRNFKIEPIKG
jgi:polar amino acid transport system substrate-binding protein